MTFKPSLFQARHILMMDTLRAGPELRRDYPIEAEYPLILDPEANDHSFCLTDDTQRLLAHANFWTRELKYGEQTFQVALIANVATLPEYQGRGFMKMMFQHLFKIASDHHLDALLLWSDQSSFYQKLGFWPYGEEWRFCFLTTAMQNYKAPYKIQLIEPKLCSDKDLVEMMTLRYPNRFHLERSFQEFKKLLSIPDMILLHTKDEHEQLTNFAFVGKGCDMMAVIHEWGCHDPHFILSAVKWLCDKTGWSYVQLLSPASLDEEWRKLFCEFSQLDKHATVLAKIQAHSPLFSLEKDFFVWGLDSI